MEHAKKMILVPQDFFAKLNQQKNEQTGLTSNLDVEMGSLLDNESLGEKEKWVRYQQMLQRYLTLKEQERQPLKVTMEESKQETTRPPVSLHQEIIETIPKMFKKKANMLLQRLESSNDVSWDERGVVTIKGNVILGSNIIDLVSDAVRPRKTSNPLGWPQFTSFLKEINIPKEFISNPRRLAYMVTGVVSTPPEHKKRQLVVRSSPISRTVRRLQARRGPPPNWREPYNSSSEEEPKSSSWERFHL